MENLVRLRKLRNTFQNEICQLLEMGGELMMGLLPNVMDKLSLSVVSPRHGWRDVQPGVQRCWP